MLIRSSFPPFPLSSRPDNAGHAQQMLVVPAFETVLATTRFPANKDEVTVMYRAREVVAFYGQV